MRFPWRSRSQREADLNEEIEAHLLMAAADGVARGETGQAISPWIASASRLVARIWS